GLPSAALAPGMDNAASPALRPTLDQRLAVFLFESAARDAWPVGITPAWMTPLTLASAPLVELPTPALQVASRPKMGADDDIDVDVSNPRHRDNRLVRLDRD